MRTILVLIGLCFLISITLTLVRCQPVEHEIDASATENPAPELIRPKRTLFFLFHPEGLLAKLAQFSGYQLTKTVATRKPRPKTTKPSFTTIKPRTTTESIIGFVFKKTQKGNTIRIEKQWITPRTTTTKPPIENTDDATVSSGEDIGSDLQPLKELQAQPEELTPDPEQPLPPEPEQPSPPESENKTEDEFEQPTAPQLTEDSNLSEVPQPEQEPAQNPGLESNQSNEPLSLNAQEGYQGDLPSQQGPYPSLSEQQGPPQVYPTMPGQQGPQQEYPTMAAQSSPQSPVPEQQNKEYPTGPQQQMPPQGYSYIQGPSPAQNTPPEGQYFPQDVQSQNPEAGPGQNQPPQDQNNVLEQGLPQGDSTTQSRLGPDTQTDIQGPPTQQDSSSASDTQAPSPQEFPSSPEQNPPGENYPSLPPGETPQNQNEVSSYQDSQRPPSQSFPDIPTQSQALPTQGEEPASQNENSPTKPQGEIPQQQIYQDPKQDQYQDLPSQGQGLPSQDSEMHKQQGDEFPQGQPAPDPQNAADPLQQQFDGLSPQTLNAGQNIEGPPQQGYQNEPYPALEQTAQSQQSSETPTTNSIPDASGQSSGQIDPFQQPGPNQNNFMPDATDTNGKTSLATDIVQLTGPSSDSEFNNVNDPRPPFDLQKVDEKDNEVNGAEKSIGLDNIARVSGPAEEARFLGDIRRATLNSGELAPTSATGDQNPAQIVAATPSEPQQQSRKRARNTPRNVLELLRRDNKNRRRFTARASKTA